MRLEAPAFSFAIAAAAWSAAAPAQVAIGVGGGVVYGPVVASPYALYAPVVVVPYSLAPGYGAFPLQSVPRSEGLPSCYRAGRCTAAELYAVGARQDRLDRLAPSAPDAPQAGRPTGTPSNAAPTAESEIQPAYRGASLPRDEFRESGTPR
jgi:hypothetical protein